MRLPPAASLFTTTPRHRRSALCAAILVGLAGIAQASTSGIVISQVYGGGGNSGAVLTHDFIELFNAGTAAVNLTGWSVQYASSTGDTWNNKTSLGNVTLQPGRYFLIRQAQGTGGTQALPAPDLSGTIAMGGSTGKVALVSSTVSLSGTNPSGATVVDLVAYGAASSAVEGAPTANLGSTLAAQRQNGGCTDTDVNNADFTVAAPAPRNSATPALPCDHEPGTGPGTDPNPTITPIHTIQGAGGISPLAGQTVTTQGVVTKVMNNGFFMQALVPDNDPMTSEGILVFTGTAPTVVPGQLMQLKGVVDEFNTGAATNAQTLANTVTELKTISQLSTLSSGHSVTPTVIAFPELTEGDLERVEGMLVTIDTELTVGQNYFLGRYGQVTLSAEGRLIKPTNQFRPGSVEAQQALDANARRRIVLDDGRSVQNPNPTPYLAPDNTLRAGDTVDSITGVIDYGLATASNTGLADHRIHPTEPVAFTRANARTSAPADVGGNVKVASFNVLNYFNGNGVGGGFPTARGANTLVEFNRQKAKIIAALKALDADVVGLMEIENDGSGAQSAVVDLVNGLNATMGAGTYAVVPDPSTGSGTDEIKVALIFKPGKVSRAGASLSDTAAIHNRPPLAQAFTAPNGERFTVVVNHFKSKGCGDDGGADADQNDGQGCYNARRVAQAQALRGFVTGLQASTGDADVLVIGDLNAYGQEDPIHDLTSHGLNDLIAQFNGGADYSYVFDGEAGYLDHALASVSLTPQVTGTAHWHINADEPFVIDYNTEFKQPACAACGPDYYSAGPYRSSDHDPVVIGLNLVKRIAGGGGRAPVNGTPGDDVITAGEGAQTITGGNGRDVFVYTGARDGLDTITDFTPGTDRLDLQALLASLGVAPSQAVASGHLRLIDAAGGVQLQLDADGAAGAGVPRGLVTLRGVSATQVQPARDLGL
ncbi:MAG: ExeM/NucH family extracellular endonuclease [Rubrivivax sp.]|nr:MAG: ExeM/NucH family extracellular endonuclease [Rubrivivax sp.]